jgi:hypothetical protein
MTVFMAWSAKQICVENGGIFPVLAGPAGTPGAFLAVTAQPLITVCHTPAAVALILIDVCCSLWKIHKAIRTIC